MNKSISLLTVALTAGLLCISTSAPVHGAIPPNFGCMLKLNRIVADAQAAMQAEVDEHADDMSARVRRFQMTAQLFKVTHRCLHQFDAEKRSASEAIGAFIEDVSFGTLADDNLAAIEVEYQKARKAIALTPCSQLRESAVANLEDARNAAISEMATNLIRNAGAVNRVYNATSPSLPECVRPL